MQGDSFSFRKDFAWQRWQSFFRLYIKDWYDPVVFNIKVRVTIESKKTINNQQQIIFSIYNAQTYVKLNNNIMTQSNFNPIQPLGFSSYFLQDEEVLVNELIDLGNPGHAARKEIKTMAITLVNNVRAQIDKIVTMMKR